jgi:hypothetical protein
MPESHLKREVFNAGFEPYPYWISVTSQDLDVRKARWEHESMFGRGVPVPIPLEEHDQKIRGMIISIRKDGSSSYITCDRAQGLLLADSELLVASHGDVMAVNDTLDTDLMIKYSSPLFNDIHSLRKDNNGGVILSSTGTDSLFQINKSGDIIWSWFATENGYSKNTLGNTMQVDTDVDHRKMVYDTWLNTTHINSALDLGSVVLATLFHQGELISINKKTGEPNTLIRDLKKPHALRFGKNQQVTLANTALGQVLSLDIDVSGEANVSVMSNRVIASLDTRWLQDAWILDDGTIMAVDGESSRVLHADKNGTLLAIDHYDPTYLLYDIELVL